MSGVNERAAPAEPTSAEAGHSASLALAVLVGVALALSARASALALLVVVAALQALLAFAWVLGSDLPGRKGALVLAGMAAAAADVCVSVWPHGRLGSQLAVLGLAVPLLFVHQLMRGAARVRVSRSLAAVSLLVLAEVSLPSLLQLRHEFADPDVAGTVVSGVAVIAAGALTVGFLVDMIVAAPRFDPAVPRGLLAVLASAGLGGSVGYLMLQSGGYSEFVDGRGAFIGASLGALVGLLAVGVAFVEHDLDEPASAPARRLRPAVAVLVPLAVLAPLAYLLCLAVRA
jgi:hypothetical protein